MKKILLITLTLIMISCNKKNNFEKQINWTNFYFKSDTVYGKYYDKSSMFIQVKLENDTTKYEMQFDTGANMTEFYENSIREINSVASKIDTFNVNQYSTAVKLFLGNYKSQVSAFPIRKNWGEKNSKLIGTIGTNEFKNKILVIDYPKEQIAILDSIPSEYKSEYEFTNFDNPEGQVYLKSKINDSIFTFLFDTGSSTTPIITTIPLYEKFTGKNKTDIDTIKANSWNITVIAPGAKNKYPVKIRNLDLKSNQRVYGTDAKHTLEFFKINKLDGLISNPYFFNDIILIDFKNKKFGVKK